MPLILYICLMIISGIAITMTCWRLASQRYRLPCPAWLGWMVEMDNPLTKVNRAATIIDHLNLSVGMTVLDIGCGPGRLTIPAAHAVGPHGRVTAVDLQQAMLSRVMIKAIEHDLDNITTVEHCIGTGEHLLGGSYDRILLVTVIGEIPTPEDAFTEIAALLKPDGILSVTELVFDPHFQRRTSIRALADYAGLKEVACFGSWYAYTMHLQKK